MISGAAGHFVAHKAVPREEIAQNRVEEYTG